MQALREAQQVLSRLLSRDRRVAVLLVMPLMWAAAVLLGWVLNQVFDLGDPGAHTFGWAGAAVAILASTLWFGVETIIVRAERNARQEVILEVNHHVKNALQTIRMSELNADTPEIVTAVENAVSHIEWTLKYVLPGVHDPTATMSRIATHDIVPPPAKQPERVAS